MNGGCDYCDSIFAMTGQKHCPVHTEADSDALEKAYLVTLCNKRGTTPGEKWFCVRPKGHADDCSPFVVDEEDAYRSRI